MTDIPEIEHILRDELDKKDEIIREKDRRLVWVREVLTLIDGRSEFEIKGWLAKAAIKKIDGYPV